MAYLVPIYCIITAISAVLLLLKMKLLLTFFLVASAILALAIGDDIRDLAKPGPASQKMIRAFMIAFMVLVCFWMAQHVSVNLYLRYVDGPIWMVVGVVLGFVANQGYVARSRRR